jgi:hypothetical protein
VLDCNDIIGDLSAEELYREAEPLDKMILQQTINRRRTAYNKDMADSRTAENNLPNRGWLGNNKKR